MHQRGENCCCDRTQNRKNYLKTPHWHITYMYTHTTNPNTQVMWVPVIQKKITRFKNSRKDYRYRQIELKI